MTTDPRAAEPATDRLGAVLRDDHRVGLRFERRLAHPPEKVWRALTESENLRHWFPADVVGERRSGAELTLPFWSEVVAEHPDETAELTGRLLTWEPPRLWEWTWDTDHLRFELEPDGPDGSATRLVFTSWVGSEGPHGLPGTLAGYHVCLDALEQLLEDGSAGSVAEVDTAGLEAAYQRVVGED